MRFEFQQIGIDLDDFFLGIRSWHTFTEFLDWFPAGGAYYTSVREDDELIGHHLDTNGEQKGSAFPALYGWTNQRQDFADVKDLLNALISVTARSDKPAQPLPRPRDAYTRWRKLQRRKNTDFLNQKLGLT